MYNLRSNLTKMAVIGGIGLAGIATGEAMDSEAIQTISAYALAGSVVGALIVGARGMIDRERPYSQNAGSQQVRGQRNVQSYSSRRPQRDQQIFARDTTIREELYNRNIEIATDRINRDGFGGWFWRRYYGIKDRLFLK